MSIVCQGSPCAARPVVVRLPTIRATEIAVRAAARSTSGTRFPSLPLRPVLPSLVLQFWFPETSSALRPLSTSTLFCFRGFSDLSVG
ncbi:predicted protein [Streptomyces viridochromogenes DSM 40736]|uniref:Predicted protein n=1 Tax=Streptomyces viridochromogenes (strain DSM 40736 / JCM 4977 / BCRC 1201 / Tue 494) TaxID=591159 RepID=D9X2A5_STRVT|nr:predicted protein [Streptomyces viridochromogenes DSM 40736]